MISALTFFSGLNWLDGKPLQIEPYRRDIFRKSLDTYRYDGIPQYNFVLAGRGKKNNKSLDLILAGLYSFMFREDPRGSDALVVANDEDQARQDLDLARKLIAANPDLADELVVLEKEIRRKDGKGIMRILPAGNIVGQHGKTGVFLGFDEIHGQKDHALFEALAPDPTRYCLTWVTSYDSIFDEAGAPLFDFKSIGMQGSDERMLFSWYSGDFTTDPAFASLSPEERANPSMASWPEGKGYLAQQRRRLPSAKYRRLHLNLPGSPQGAHFDQGAIERAIVAGRQEIEPQDGIDYLAFVDMSGGSSDDAVLGLAHWTGTKAVLDLLVSQGTAVPFNPRLAVARFVTYCRKYRCRSVHGDAYAGLTFRHDFSDLGIDYIVCQQSKTDLYEGLEVATNADQVELLDLPKLRSELMTIIRRGASLDHMPGRHDDWANAAAGALVLANPDIGKTTPSILTFIERQVAAATQQGPPTLQQEHAGATILQIGNRPQHPADYVRVTIPTEASHVVGISGVSYLVEMEGEQRICWMSASDALALCNAVFGGTHFREANLALHADLMKTVGRKSSAPGITWADIVRATEESQPRSIFDRGGIAHDALRSVGRWP